MIQVNELIEAPAAPDAVWRMLSSPAIVISCVPGATMRTEPVDGAFDASITVRFGPTKVTFHGTAVLELDAPELRGRLLARGRDTQGGSRFKAAADFSVTERPAGAGSVVPIVATVEVSGRLAGLIEDGARIVVRRMSAAFAEGLAERYSRLPDPRRDLPGHGFEIPDDRLEIPDDRLENPDRRFGDPRGGWPG